METTTIEMKKQIEALKALQAKIEESKKQIAEQKKKLAEAKKAEAEAKKAVKKPNRYTVFALILRETAKKPLTFAGMVERMQESFPDGSRKESEYKVQHGLSFATALNLVVKTGETYKFTGK